MNDFHIYAVDMVGHPGKCPYHLIQEWKIGCKSTCVCSPPGWKTGRKSTCVCASPGWKIGRKSTCVCSPPGWKIECKTACVCLRINRMTG